MPRLRIKVLLRAMLMMLKSFMNFLTMPIDASPKTGNMRRLMLR